MNYDLLHGSDNPHLSQKGSKIVLIACLQTAGSPGEAATLFTQVYIRTDSISGPTAPDFAWLGVKKRKMAKLDSKWQEDYMRKVRKKRQFQKRFVLSFLPRSCPTSHWIEIRHTKGSKRSRGGNFPNFPLGLVIRQNVRTSLKKVEKAGLLARWLMCQRLQYMWSWWKRGWGTSRLRLHSQLVANKRKDGWWVMARYLLLLLAETFFSLIFRLRAVTDVSRCQSEAYDN